MAIFTLMEQLLYLQDPTEGLEADLLIDDRRDEVEVLANEQEATEQQEQVEEKTLETVVAEEESADRLFTEAVEEEQAAESTDELVEEEVVVESTDELVEEEVIAESTDQLLQEKDNAESTEEPLQEEVTSELADDTLLEGESSPSSDEAAVIEEQLELENEMLASLSLTSSVLEQYVWNDANRLISHTNEAGDVTTYRYDGDHNRVYMGAKLGSLDGASDYPSAHPLGDRIGWEPQYKKQQTSIYFANDTTLSYVEPLMAISEDRSWKQNYMYGALGERISMSYLPSGDASNAWEPTPGASGANAGNVLTTLYYLSDVRGSALSLMDEQGNIAARYHYDEFGIVQEEEKFDLNWPGPDNLFGYTGLGYDYTSGLNNARARYFDASVGRFISEDTVEGDRVNPLSMNLYTYVQNNPNKYVDPSGNVPVLIAILGKALLNYAIDVMIGVGMDYLAYVQSGSSKKFDMSASLKKNAKESAVPGLGTIKKISRAVKLADQIKKAQKAAKAKSVNLPSYKKMKIDITHIISGHTVGGSRAKQSGRKDLFPSNMNKSQIEKTVRDAYKNASKIQTQGDRILVRGKANGLNVEMWVNKKTMTIETAYPIN